MSTMENGMGKDITADKGIRVNSLNSGKKKGPGKRGQNYNFGNRRSSSEG